MGAPSLAMMMRALEAGCGHCGRPFSENERTSSLFSYRKPHAYHDACATELRPTWDRERAAALAAWKASLPPCEVCAKGARWAIAGVALCGTHKARAVTGVRSRKHAAAGVSLIHAMHYQPTREQVIAFARGE